MTGESWQDWQGKQTGLVMIVVRLAVKVFLDGAVGIIGKLTADLLYTFHFGGKNRHFYPFSPRFTGDSEAKAGDPDHRASLAVQA